MMYCFHLYKLTLYFWWATVISFLHRIKALPSLLFTPTNGLCLKFLSKRNNFLNINYVNERGSTLRARFRYWEIWPPNYFIRWLPKEILFPPANLDAIVALILLEDFLKYKLIWPIKVNIKTWP